MVNLANLRFASAPGGADGPFPAVPVTPGVIPFLTAASSAVNWGFEEFDDRAPGPLLTYVVRWYQQAGTPVIPQGFYTRFDLFSPNPPVAGGGAVDLGPGSSIGFDDGSGNISMIASPTVTESASQDTSTPAGFAGMTFASVPEPSSVVLVGMGMIGLVGSALRSRHRRFD